MKEKRCCRALLFPKAKRRGAVWLLCFRIIAIIASVACGAQTAYAERLRGDFGLHHKLPRLRSKMHRLVDDSERAIVHAGFGAMMLMDLLDDEIEFGYSDYWYVEVGAAEGQAPLVLWEVG